MSDKPTPPPAGDSTSWQPPSPEELQPLLPQYEITALIGHGGMGAVYRGQQANLDRLVAIKILPPGLDDTDATFSERFRNEALAMAKLNHPGLVAVYDFGKTANGMLYIVMEFVDGTDVAQMMAKQGRLSSKHAMAITAHVCDALKYAHDRGIVHRDIKPANIMVGYDGVVKVADFGLAKMSQAGQSTGLTQSGMAMGTMHYIAPEALTLGTSVDQRADIYAMGVMLYHMLTGGLPQGMFELPSLQVPGLDPRYDSIISRALRNDRYRRYQSVGELRHDLDAIITQPVVQVDSTAKKAPAALNTAARPQRPAGQPYRPSHKPASPPPPPQKRGNLGFWVPVVGAVVVCVGIVVWAKQAKSGSPTPTDVVTSETLIAPTIAEAAKERPFINSLGMKFVPVPGTESLMCIHETRNQDYKSYASAVRGVNPSPVFTDKTPVDQAGDHPVRNVRYDDAVGFCQWLSLKEGKTYRLPTDQEWSFAIGIGLQEKREADTTPEKLNGKLATDFPWGSQWPPPKDYGNFADTSRKEAYPTTSFIERYTDEYPTTAPVMSFQPNSLGLYDMSGNLSEWVQDWWNAQQKDRTIRGAGYGSSEKRSFYASFRGHLPPSVLYSNANLGFRCVVEIGRSESGTDSSVSGVAGSELASGTQFTTVSLDEIAKQPLDHLLNPPTGRVIYQGVPFEFASPPKRYSSNDQTVASIKVSIRQPTSIHLLIVGGGNGKLEYQGKETGVIKLGFADGTEYSASLKPGTILRSGTWAYNDENMPTPPGDDIIQVVNVVTERQNRGRPAQSFIDMLTIELPASKSRTALSTITLCDTSTESVNDVRPRFDIFGLTVGHSQ